MPLPDPRAFTVPSDYLNAWCAAQPARDPQDLVADLASYAGVSWTHMRFVLSGDRTLALSAVAGLVKGLALPEDQAEHFRRTVELKLAPARASVSLPLATLDDGNSPPSVLICARREATFTIWFNVAISVSEQQCPSLTGLLSPSPAV